MEIPPSKYEKVNINDVINSQNNLDNIQKAVVMQNGHSVAYYSRKLKIQPKEITLPRKKNYYQS